MAVAGAAALALGGIVAALPGALRAGLIAQAAGVALLGATGVTLVAGDQTVGAAFGSDVAPALGLDPLSGFFLAVLAVTARPGARVRARLPRRRAAPARARRARRGVPARARRRCSRPATSSTFLAFWELMTLVPAAAILVARRDAAVARAPSSSTSRSRTSAAPASGSRCSRSPHHGALGDPAASPRRRRDAGARAIAALVGFGTKAGLVPLHSWLPRAHPVAPAPHLGADVGRDDQGRALRADPRAVRVARREPPLGRARAAGARARCRRSAACSTRSSSTTSSGCSPFTRSRTSASSRSASAPRCCSPRRRRQWAAIAFAAALLHIANHAVFKALLFLGAGAFERAVGALDLDRLGGLLRRMPWTGGAFLVGVAAIAGVPPLNGFASEWLTLQALLHVALDAAARRRARRRRWRPPASRRRRRSRCCCFVKVVGLVLLGRAAARRSARRRPTRRSGCARRWRRSPRCASCSASCPGSSCRRSPSSRPAPRRALPVEPASTCRAPARCRRSRSRSRSLALTAPLVARCAARGAPRPRRPGPAARRSSRRSAGRPPASPSRCGSCSRRCCARAARSTWTRRRRRAARSPTGARCRSSFDTRAVRAGDRAPGCARPRVARRLQIGQPAHVRCVPARARARAARAGPARGARVSARHRRRDPGRGRRARAAAARADPDAQGAPAGPPRRRRRCSPTASCAGCGARAPSTRERRTLVYRLAPASSPPRRSSRCCCVPIAGALAATGRSATTRSSSSACSRWRASRSPRPLGHRLRLRADGRRRAT